MGGTGAEDTRSGGSTSDGGYIVAGATMSSAGGDVNNTELLYNYPWVVKLKGNGTGIGEQFENNVFVVYPNPVNNTLNITGISANAAVKIYDIVGREVLTASANSGTIDISKLANGSYTVLIFEKGNMTGKTRFIKN